MLGLPMTQFTFWRTLSLKKWEGEGVIRFFRTMIRKKTVVLACHGKKIKSGYIKSIRKAIENEK